MTPCTVAYQAPLSMGFPRQEYWSDLPFPSPKDRHDSGVERTSLLSPVSTGRFFTTGKPISEHRLLLKSQPMVQVFYWIPLRRPYRLIRLSSVQFSRSVMSNSLQPHELQHTRPPCPSPTPGVHSNSRPSSRWCHPAISSSVVPFFSCPQPLPASESFPMSQLFA